MGLPEILDQEYQLVVSTEIFLECEEIPALYMSAEVAETTTKAIAHASNTIFVTKWYTWNLIHADPDDNKFTDAYVSAGADYIVTEDAHFNVLKNITFPSIKVIGLEAFRQLLHDLKLK